MIDIYNEVAYIKNVLQDGFSSKWQRDAKLLTKYYKLEGVKKCEAKDNIIKKCMDTKGRFTFNPYQEDINNASSIFEKAWKDKTPLREISKVEISKEVLEWFLSLETDYVITDERQAELKKRRPNVSIKNNRPINWKRTKYLFTLYIWTKIQENYLNKPNIHYIQECAKRFREDADLKPSFILNNERNLLYDLGFININYALGIEVTFIDKFDVFKIPITDDNRIVIELYKDGIMKREDGSLVSEEEGDLHRCGYWLEKQKMGSFVCKSCGKETAYYGKGKNEHRRKYCKECISPSKFLKPGTKRGEGSLKDRFCVDCGEKIMITSANDFRSCRCEDCKRIRVNELKRKARNKYKESKKGGQR